MITNHIGGSVLHDATPIRDGAYGVPWKQKSLSMLGLDLPTEDYAEYLVNTVSFNMSPLYYLYDKSAFLAKLRDFYAHENAGKEQITDLWHIHLLLVFAFGKSLLAREVGSLGPTGTIYFVRAFEALPDSHRLCQQPIPSIEVLCTLALYMQAMDMRLAAHDYVCITDHQRRPELIH